MKPKTIAIIAVILIASGLVLYRPAETEKEPIDLTKYDVATFAGGCFWCMEASFEATEGVIEAVSGYTGGDLLNPTYQQVLSKTTGHLEAVQVYYDPDLISYRELLDVYWRNIDPTDATGQFVDKGPQYQTAIFYHDMTQRTHAEESKTELDESLRFDEPIVTEILELDVFYRAEENHQDYYLKQVLNYKLYSSNSGREEFKQEHWDE